MVLHKAESVNKIDKITDVSKLLVEREDKWTNAQKELQRQRIEEKYAKGQNQKNYVNKLLQWCKSWGGPCTSVQELDAILKLNCDQVEKIVKIELSYYRHTQ